MGFCPHLTHLSLVGDLKNLDRVLQNVKQANDDGKMLNLTNLRLDASANFHDSMPESLKQFLQTNLANLSHIHLGNCTTQERFFKTLHQFAAKFRLQSLAFTSPAAFVDYFPSGCWKSVESLHRREQHHSLDDQLFNVLFSGGFPALKDLELSPISSKSPVVIRYLKSRQADRLSRLAVNGDTDYELKHILRFQTRIQQLEISSCRLSESLNELFHQKFRFF